VQGPVDCNRIQPKFGRITFTRQGSESLARLWAALLGWELRKVGQNRIHFDLTGTSIEHQQELVALAIELGGGHVGIGQTPDEGHVVLADPRATSSV